MLPLCNIAFTVSACLLSAQMRVGLTLAVAIVVYCLSVYRRTGVFECIVSSCVAACFVLVSENSSKWHWETINALIMACVVACYHVFCTTNCELGGVAVMFATVMLWPVHVLEVIWHGLL